MDHVTCNGENLICAWNLNGSGEFESFEVFQITDEMYTRISNVLFFSFAFFFFSFFFFFLLNCFKRKTKVYIPVILNVESKREILSIHYEKGLYSGVLSRGVFTMICDLARQVVELNLKEAITLQSKK